jgi:glutathione synthase/RimK-type ligase-like ATP-grasp enzyme
MARLPLALVTCQQMPQLYRGERPLVEALASAGFSPTPAIWDDPQIDWDGFEAILLRNPWDYFHAPARFAAWLDDLGARGARLFNSAATARRNMDKRYLLDLASAGVPVIQTRYLPRGARGALSQIAALGADEVVLKPAISGGGHLTTRHLAADHAGLQAALDQIHRHGDALAQPFLPEIATQGERSLIFFGGAFSHAVQKTAAPGQFLIHEIHGGAVSPFQPTQAQIDAAADALRAWGEPCLYARVDAIARGDQLLLMELELIEPELFLQHDPGAAARLAAALREAL